MEAFQTDLEAYIKHLDKLRKDFKIWFGDLNNMHVHEWLLTPLDMKISNEGYESDLEHKPTAMHVVLEAKALLKGKSLAEY